MATLFTAAEIAAMENALLCIVERHSRDKIECKDAEIAKIGLGIICKNLQDDYTCSACGRLELDCSLNPCKQVQADRLS